MKYIFSIQFFILLACSNLAAQEKNSKSPAVLTHVNVYRSGAELHHRVSCNLPSGTHEFIITNISDQIKENSILFTPNEQVSILNISPVKESNSIKLNDIDQQNLSRKETEYQQIQHQLMGLKGAQEILDANKKVNGENTTLNVVELAKVISFYESKTSEIQNKIADLNRRQEILNEEIFKLSREKQKDQLQIKIQVQCNKAVNTQLQFSYFTESASWKPQYDIKSQGMQSALTLAFKAEVFQFTGLDWKNISMALSTANPTLSGMMPTLSPWFLKQRAPSVSNEQNANGQLSNYKYSTSDFAAMQGGVYQSKTHSFAENKSESNHKPQVKMISGGTETETGVNTQFEVDIPYTILSKSGGSSIVPIKEYQLSTQYKYYCIPKKDPDAFFLAEISDWEDLNLITGPANIFFDGNFTGKSMIDASSTRDTLNVSLGRDKKIIVKREKLKDYCTHKVIGSKNTQTITYEIRVRNTRKETAQIIVEDQFPLSTNKDIEIELEETSAATIDNQSGLLTWKLKIPPNETKKLKISYTVKYPKDQQLGPLF